MKKILLIGSAGVVASALTVVLIFSPVEKTLRSGLESETSSPQQTQAPSDKATSTMTTDYLAEQARAAASFSRSSTVPQASGSQMYTRVDQPSSASPSDRTSHSRNESVSSIADEASAPEVTEPYLPFVFLDHSQALPATEEAAAAIENLRRDFMSKNGVATAASPADPNYAQSWAAAQALADDQFYARFGSEAYSAMWAERVRQLGHF